MLLLSPYSLQHPYIYSSSHFSASDNFSLTKGTPGTDSLHTKHTNAFFSLYLSIPYRIVGDRMTN